VSWDTQQENNQDTNKSRGYTHPTLTLETFASEKKKFSLRNKQAERRENK
jgi:hypothetical protein